MDAQSPDALLTRMFSIAVVSRSLMRNYIKIALLYHVKWFMIILFG